MSLSQWFYIIGIVSMSAWLLFLIALIIGGFYMARKASEAKERLKGPLLMLSTLSKPSVTTIISALALLPQAKQIYSSIFGKKRS